jgi:hypothetical protein
MQISPVADIKPLIANARMTRLGEPLGQTLVINLANDLISDTNDQDWVKVSKTHHKTLEGKVILVKADILQLHEEIKYHKTKVEKIKPVSAFIGFLLIPNFHEIGISETSLSLLKMTAQMIACSVTSRMQEQCNGCQLYS